MIPPLNKKLDVSVAVTPEVKRRKPDGETEYSALRSAAEDLLSAVKASDPAGIEAAMRSAFIILESEPHEEGSSLGEIE